MDKASVQSVIDNLRAMIELSNLEKEVPWQQWIESTVHKRDIRCWEKTNCGKTDCPAFQNDCGRCWLIAGTLCACEVTGKKARKIESCLKCEVLQGAIADGQAVELQELLIILVYNLRENRRRLEETRREVKLLEGLLPICAACKKIRDGEQRWHSLESYIHDHSMAEFTHGLCPDCLPIYFTPEGEAAKSEPE